MDMPFGTGSAKGKLKHLPDAVAVGSRPETSS
jgi:hypothetical protein